MEAFYIVPFSMFSFVLIFLARPFKRVKFVDGRRVHPKEEKDIRIQKMVVVSMFIL